MFPYSRINASLSALRHDFVSDLACERGQNLSHWLKLLLNYRHEDSELLHELLQELLDVFATC
jgi:hypothetical protein